MPNVTDDFVNHARTLAQAVPALLEKLSHVQSAAATTVKEAAESVRIQAEVVADTLIAHGIVAPTEKSAAVSKLSDHREALNVLNRTANLVTAQSMGRPHQQEKVASENGSSMRESDRALFARLGLPTT